MTYTMSQPGYAVVRSFEGRSLKAYRDEVGVWTIGYGNTNADRDVLGFEIKAGVTINEEQCEALLEAAIHRRYEPSVNAHMAAGLAREPRANVAQAAFDAGGSFDYNTGAIARASWVKSYAARNLAATHSQIIQWNKAGGNVLAGLVRRRNREWEMINTGDYGPEGRQTVITDERGRTVSVAAKEAPAVVAKPIATVTTPAPSSDTAGASSRLQPWHARMESILGLYEVPGSGDNPCILAMAQQCGGNIARTYKHDSTAWCALTLNWCMITTGFKGTGTLLALDWRKKTQRLDGPFVGAIATKTRNGGGHVFIVRGRTADGHLVGTGGNQADMVCDEIFDPHVCQFGWPLGLPLPAKVGLGTLPIVEPRPKTHRVFNALPNTPGDGVSPIHHPALQNANPPASVAEGTGMLHHGDTGDEVVQAQALLTAAGYNVAGDKGMFGVLTESATLDYQRRHPQLEATGFIDPATRAALKRDASAKTGLKRTAKTTGGTAGTTGTTDAATGGHLPWEVYAIGGVVALAVVAYICWSYRDEIRAMFKARFA